MSLPTTFFIGRGGGGPGLPLFSTQGASYQLVNYGDPWVTQSSNSAIAFGNTVYSDSHNYYVRDAFSQGWYIAANWTWDSTNNTSNPNLTRWGGQNAAKLFPTGSRTLYTTLDGTAITQNNVRATSQITSTSSGTFSTLMANKGSFYDDGTTYNNTGDDGWMAMFADSNTSDQKYRGVSVAVTNYFNSGTQFDGVSQGNDEGGYLYWTPPEGASEVYIDFGNAHSNSRTALTVWDDSTGQIVHQWNFGRFSTVNTGGSIRNDNSTRSMFITHEESYVYILSDHEGTIVGSHYYLYR